MEQHRNTTSLVRRLFYSLVAITFVTASLFAAVGILYTNYKGQQELELLADEYIQSLTRTLEVPVWGFDEETVKGAVQAYALNDHIASIKVTGSDGRVLAQVIKETPADPVIRSTAIEHQGLIAGQVELVLTSRVTRDITFRFLLYSAIALGVTLLAAFLTARSVLKHTIQEPLRELSNVVDAYGRGNYSIPAQSPYAEFQGLVRVLGSMAKRIQDKVAELEVAEEQYRTLVENTEDIITWVDNEGRFLFINPSSMDFLGLEPEQCIGLVMDDFIHPSDRVSHKERMDSWVASEKTVFNQENRIISRSGKVRTVHWTVSKHLDEDGSAKGFTGIGRDITQRKAIEEELRHLRNFLSNIINSMPSVLIGVDHDGRVTQWNTEASNRTGISMDDAMGQPLDQVFPRIAREMDRVRQTMLSRTASSGERQVRMVEGQLVYEDVSVFPLVDNGVEGAVIRVDDVTERVRLEQMMIQSEKMLSVGGLAAGMAHEINNPLAAIIGYAQNMQKRLLGNLKKNDQAADECGLDLGTMHTYLDKRSIPEMLEGISASGKRAATIVSNMLSFSRKSDKRFSSHNIADLLETTLELAASDYDLKREYDFKKIEIVRNYAPDAPPILCESNEMQQVFLNLIRNGAEAMFEKAYPEGEGPCLTLAVRLDNDALLVELEDNGPGMDDITRKRIFEPFFTTKPVGQGTGLGLSVSYFIVTELHKGSLAVYAAPGAWTRFEIRLPLQRDMA